MISATAEHALRAVLLLARNNASGALSADAIADELGAPRNYLAKTLNSLAKAGIVKSARGAAGGFSLSVDPSELTLERIMAPFADHTRRRACLLRNQLCDPANPCALHNHWNAVMEFEKQHFKSTTLADLLAEIPADSELPVLACGE